MHMRLSTLMAGASIFALFTSGCADNTIRALPNRAPVASALVDSGDENTADQRLGYVIQGGSATLDGSLSDDVDDPGQPALLAFQWSFDSIPDDSGFVDGEGNIDSSALVVPEDDPDTDDVNESAFPTFTPDTLGTYRVQLIVIDDDGEPSTPSIAVVQAVPPSDLSVHLEWADNRADLDLHLIGPDGSYFGDGDCFSWEPNPEWGESGLATDNPELTGDADGEGSSPYREQINLEEPPEGDYEVWVHYYSDHSVELGGPAVPATAEVEVRVFDSVLSGSELESDPLLAGDVWKVGVLSWPERSFAPLNQASDHASEGGPAYNE
ncbi:MAG: hypothetical protein GY898_02560 [Proteobacteria bacterium]|nr:hypothetical protein [Pseudomonadota bacterium]